MPAWRMPHSTMPSLRTSEGEVTEEVEDVEEGNGATEAAEDTEGAEGMEGTEGAEGTEGEGFTCSVCLCDLMAGEMVRTLPLQPEA